MLFARDNNRATSRENLFLPYANNKGADQPAHPRSANNNGADQPAHPRSLISTFVVRCQDNIRPLLAMAEITRF